jgi:hypothetical protein
MVRMRLGLHARCPCHTHSVVPAQAGIQFWTAATAFVSNWIPAFAGMTSRLGKRISAPVR